MLGWALTSMTGIFIRQPSEETLRELGYVQVKSTLKRLTDLDFQDRQE